MSLGNPHITNASSLLVAIIVLAILLFLDRSTVRYQIYWIVSSLIAISVSVLFWFYIYSIPLYSELSSVAAIPPDKPHLILGPIFSLRESSVRASFSILILMGWFPPKSFRWLLRCLLAIGSTACGLALSLLFVEKVEVYTDDYFTHAREIKQEIRAEQTRKNAPIVEWNELRDPDSELGPQSNGEWRWLGFGTYYGTVNPEPGMSLRMLTLNGDRVDNERALRAFSMLKHATEIEELRLENLVLDNKVEYLIELGSLKRLKIKNSQITEEGLANLATLGELASIKIESTPITDVCLDLFVQFQSLQYVHLFRTNATRDGIHLFNLKHGMVWRASASLRGGFEFRLRKKDEQESLRRKAEQFEAKLKASNPQQYQENLERKRQQIEELERKIKENADLVKENQGSTIK